MYDAEKELQQHVEQTSCYYATRGFVYAEYTDTCRVLWDKEMVKLEDMRL